MHQQLNQPFHVPRVQRRVYHDACRAREHVHGHAPRQLVGRALDLLQPKLECTGVLLQSCKGRPPQYKRDMHVLTKQGVRRERDCWAQACLSCYDYRRSRAALLCIHLPVRTVTAVLRATEQQPSPRHIPASMIACTSRHERPGVA